MVEFDRHPTARARLCSGYKGGWLGIVDPLPDGSTQPFLDPQSDHHLVGDPMLARQFLGEFQQNLVHAKRNGLLSPTGICLPIGPQGIFWTVYARSRMALVKPRMQCSIVCPPVGWHRRRKSRVVRHSPRPRRPRMTYTLYIHSQGESFKEFLKAAREVGLDLLLVSAIPHTGPPSNLPTGHVRSPRPRPRRPGEVSLQVVLEEGARSGAEFPSPRLP